MLYLYIITAAALLISLTASRLRRQRAGRRGMPPRSVASLWPRHAQHGKQWTPCIYNRWFTGEAYRAELAGTLGLSTCPALPAHVARAGRDRNMGTRFEAYVSTT